LVCFAKLLWSPRQNNLHLLRLKQSYLLENLKEDSHLNRVDEFVMHEKFHEKIQTVIL
jgi:hypothetical protein